MARYFTEAEVARIIDMPLALQAVEAAHIALARGEATDVPRRRVRGGGAMLHLLQAAWPARGVMGFKSYTSSAAGARFWLHLFDATSGEPLAVIEADRLGMLRTGAAGGLAARCLSRPDARVAGIIGAGWQARGQMQALAAVREIAEFRVFARTTDKLEAFCVEMASELGVPVLAAKSAQDAVTGVDIVVTVTTSSKPVLSPDWIVPGVHINACGSNSLLRRELDEATLGKAGLLCVDGRENALLESGDLAPLLDKGRIGPRQLVELGDILAGFRPGRMRADEVTIFESQGMAIQDLALGAEVLRQSVLAGKMPELAQVQGQDLPY